jgi:hypothetical protein
MPGTLRGVNTRYRHNRAGLSRLGPGGAAMALRGAADQPGRMNWSHRHAEPWPCRQRPGSHRRALSSPGSVAIAAFVLALVALLPACASRQGGPVEVAVQAAEYERAVNIARDTLLEARFEIDRVDAAAGVITAHPRGTGGLLTPWDNQQTTLGQEVHDAANTHLRRVRITFEPAAIDRRDPGAGQAAADSPGGPSPAWIDLRTAGLPITARVEVFIDRVRRPGVRLETESIRTSTLTLDPQLASRRMTPEYRTTVGRDELLAARLADRIRERLSE